jgi:F0F1-type ATP synthase delta subunit
MKNTRLLQNVTTKRDADRLMEEIEIIRNGLFETGEGALESLLKNKVRRETAEIIKETFSKTEVNKKEYLNEVEELLTKMPNVSLILAFEPSEGAVERFYSKISEATGKNVLLDVVHEPQIIGGAVIIFNGRYRDYSFKKIFESEFEKGRNKILAIGNKGRLGIKH